MPRIAVLLDSSPNGRKTLSCDPRDFHHGLLALLAALLLTATATAGPPVEFAWNPSFGGGRAVKAFNHAVILWDVNSSARERPQLEVFDRAGKLTHQISVLGAAPEADSVSIQDLAMDQTGRVAVAAVFAGPGRNRGSTLLIYSPAGRLHKAVQLSPDRSISRLECDADGTIWALGHHPGDADPKDVPMLFHYDRDGRELAGFVSRSQFPADAEFTEEGSGVGGSPGLGVTADSVWFWLPAGRRLTTINKDGSGLTIYTTGLPGVSQAGDNDSERRTEVSRTALLSTGELLAYATVMDSVAVLESGLYRWSPSEGWAQFEHPDLPHGARLLAVTAGDKLLLRHPLQDSGRLAIATVRTR